MLQPGEIRRYRAPDYHNGPPSHRELEPQRLPFKCVVVDSVDSTQGGPPPSLLFRLRKLGCSLVFARCPASATLAADDVASEGGVDGTRDCSRLPDEWFDAVFDAVIRIEEQDGKNSQQTELEKYLEDEGIPQTQVICFTSSEFSAFAFAAIDAGLIIAPMHFLVECGADLAVSESPSVRQLAWLHHVFMEKHWCSCMWVMPAAEELAGSGHKSDRPSMNERAELSAVASPTLTALGHPPWVQHRNPCTVRVDDRLAMPCPDWTLLEPLLKWDQQEALGVGQIGKLRLYSHSLDVGIGQVNHTLEVENKNKGLHLRVSSNRFVNKAREYEAGAEMCVTLDYNYIQQVTPKLCIRSKLSGAQVLCEGQGPLLDKLEEQEHRMVRGCAHGGRAIAVTGVHRLSKDQGKGEMQINLKSSEVTVVEDGTDGILITIEKPQRGTRYIVYKIISVLVGGPTPDTSADRDDSPSDSCAADEVATLTQHAIEWPTASSTDRMLRSPPRWSDLKESHKGQWRTEWDKADMVIVGGRQAALCQRAVRLFRFHQVARFSRNFEHLSRPMTKVVTDAFQRAFVRLFFVHAQTSRGKFSDPGVLVRSLLNKHPDHETVFAISPRMPPTCSLLQFNVAAGHQWYRLTFHAGNVMILKQGLALGEVLPDLTLDIGESPLNLKVAFSEDWNQVLRDRVADVLKSGHDANKLAVVDTHGNNLGFYLNDHGDTELGAVPDPDVFPLAIQTQTATPKAEQQLTKFCIPIAGDQSHQGTVKGVFVEASPWQEVKVDHALTELGHPDGSGGGFYGVMRQTRLVRANLVWQGAHRMHPRIQRAFGPQAPQEAESEAMIRILRTAEKRLQSIPRPPRWVSNDFRDSFVHSLMAPDGNRVRVNLQYEKVELDRDIYFFTHGEEKLKERMKTRAEKRFASEVQWVDNQAIPSWSDLEEQAIRTLHAAATTQPDGTVGPRAQFRNFITDRDGTVNNYCDRYASSVQSAYNAVLLTRFARHCAKKTIILTAAPLGGRPNSEGLLELSVMDHEVVTFAGSKGREYFDKDEGKVCELEPLSPTHEELMEDLYRRLVVLCAKPENTKFLGIGSGLQQKFGEITLARNDPNRTIPEPESKRFLADVREVKAELDPEGSLLDLHDTSTDMELYPREKDGTRSAFDKGRGVEGLDQKLDLNVNLGPNLICGDTSSDVKMIEAALKLMRCNDGEAENTPQLTETTPRNFNPPVRKSFSGIEDGVNESTKNVEPQVERRPLAVLFVISPDEHKKSRNLASDIRKLCEDAGAFCTILPSPDALVWSLAEYTKQVVMQAFEEDRDDLSKLADAVGCSAAKLKGAKDLDEQTWRDKSPEAFAMEVFDGKFLG